MPPAEVVRTIEQVRDVDLVNVPVWDQQPLDGDGLQQELAEVTDSLEAGRASECWRASADVP
ncbi:hypothetical protein L2X99_11085 [Microbacterium sp. KUDC0406]|uniref:hypothetical protein n=1 Tax=Microbacterium sp. KUDC0406 TaxID=2909588 RepID=UPI001F40BE23|nr:hypothetical protein [Microbacterium sp. KUDC0406]UJP09016.1 hypothetical protein L2X99_11085 [Microbacterium sp. KUDC0406]